MTDDLAAIETRYDGHRFRSRAEARWAVFFNALDLRYEYEKEGYDLDGEWYLPDFWLPQIGYWMEIKGTDPTEGEIVTCHRLVEHTGRPLMLAVGAPETREQLILFPVGGERPDASEGSRYSFRDDRRNAGEYWLYREDHCFSIGPVDGPSHLREPVFGASTKRAFEAARSARFEHGEKPR